jgi:hypothetical protein
MGNESKDFGTSYFIRQIPLDIKGQIGLDTITEEDFNTLLLPIAESSR